mmetsp:Transcript_15851/g.26841  ORF Transcript_15851/g.26841 Transcript_15851/m.26841 type:complete len:140 (+) Transcript_15851:51-470(+)
MPQILSSKALHSRRLSLKPRRTGSQFSLRSSRTSKDDRSTFYGSQSTGLRPSFPRSDFSSSSQQKPSDPFMMLRKNSRLENSRYRRNNSESSMLQLGKSHEEDAWGQFIDVAEAEQEVAKHSQFLSGKHAAPNGFVAYY